MRSCLHHTQWDADHACTNFTESFRPCLAWDITMTCSAPLRDRFLVSLSLAGACTDRGPPCPCCGCVLIVLSLAVACADMGPRATGKEAVATVVVDKMRRRMRQNGYHAHITLQVRPPAPVQGVLELDLACSQSVLERYSCVGFPPPPVECCLGLGRTLSIVLRSAIKEVLCYGST